MGLNSSKHISQNGGIPPKCPPTQKTHQDYSTTGSSKVKAAKLKNMHSVLVRNGRYRHYDHLTSAESGAAPRAVESARSGNREPKQSRK